MPDVFGKYFESSLNHPLTPLFSKAVSCTVTNTITLAGMMIPMTT